MSDTHGTPIWRPRPRYLRPGRSRGAPSLKGGNAAWLKAARRPTRPRVPHAVRDDRQPNSQLAVPRTGKALRFDDDGITNEIAEAHKADMIVREPDAWV